MRIEGSGQWAVGSGQWAVGSGQWAVGSGQWAVGSGQWAVGSGQWAVGSGQWAVGSGQWAVGSGQWAVGSDKGQALITNSTPALLNMLRYRVACRQQATLRNRILFNINRRDFYLLLFMLLIFFEPFD